MGLLFRKVLWAVGGKPEVCFGGTVFYEIRVITLAVLNLKVVGVKKLCLR